MSASYVINRPIEYNLGRYTPGLTESAVNVFSQEVTPTDFNKDRCSFQFKSPGLNTLLSSAVFMEFDLEIKTSTKIYDYASARAPNFTMVGTGAFTDVANTTVSGASPTVCFGEGNVLDANAKEKPAGLGKVDKNLVLAADPRFLGGEGGKQSRDVPVGVLITLERTTETPVITFPSSTWLDAGEKLVDTLA